MIGSVKEKCYVRSVGGMHWLMWYCFSRAYGNILVAEYPKSGASWFSNMLADATGVPYPQNFAFPKLEHSILHGVYLYHSRFEKVICVVRDGRDVMVSAYYHFLFKNEKNKEFAINRTRKLNPFEDYNDIKTNLPNFIKFMFTTYSVKGSVMRWDQFVESYLGRTNVHIVKYEDLLLDATLELRKAISFLNIELPSDKKLQSVVEKFSFEKMSSRKPGEENTSSFYRKGVAGDWKTKFSRESCTLFDTFAGETLVKLGYEKDRSWF